MKTSSIKFAFDYLTTHIASPRSCARDKQGFTLKAVDDSHREANTKYRVCHRRLSVFYQKSRNALNPHSPTHVLVLLEDSSHDRTSLRLAEDNELLWIEMNNIDRGGVLVAQYLNETFNFVARQWSDLLKKASHF